MARPEQVLVLEPQHELKFRGNAAAVGWVAVSVTDMLLVHYNHGVKFCMDVLALSNLVVAYKMCLLMCKPDGGDTWTPCETTLTSRLASIELT